MGGIQTKEKCIANEGAVESLKNKVKILQEEINEIMCIRDAENQAYEREMMVFAFKEVEWKKEKKKLKEEVKKLRKRLEGREEKIHGMETLVMEESSKEEIELLGPLNILREVQARRDEAVEKWKQLYFAIKIELDDLIQSTCQAEGLGWKAEEEAILEELQKELGAKEETIQLLQAQVSSMKQQEYKREREIDILRQSLRIVCFNTKQQAKSKDYTRGLN